MISVKVFIDRMASALGSERAWLAEQRVEKARELIGIQMPSILERASYARRVFDTTIGEDSATRLLFRLWEAAPTTAQRTKLYATMRREAQNYEHLIEVFRLRETAVADVELAELASRRVA